MRLGQGKDTLPETDSPVTDGPRPSGTPSGRPVAVARPCVSLRPCVLTEEAGRRCGASRQAAVGRGGRGGHVTERK